MRLDAILTRLGQGRPPLIADLRTPATSGIEVQPNEAGKSKQRWLTMGMQSEDDSCFILIANCDATLATSSAIREAVL